jgi:hypothetical protein
MSGFKSLDLISGCLVFLKEGFDSLEVKKAIARVPSLTRQFSEKYEKETEAVVIILIIEALCLFSFIKLISFVLVFELKGDRHRTFIVEKNVQWKSAKTIT